MRQYFASQSPMRIKNPLFLIALLCSTFMFSSPAHAAGAATTTVTKIAHGGSHTVIWLATDMTNPETCVGATKKNAFIIDNTDASAEAWIKLATAALLSGNTVTIYGKTTGTKCSSDYLYMVQIELLSS